MRCSLLFVYLARLFVAVTVFAFSHLGSQGKHARLGEFHGFTCR